MSQTPKGERAGAVRRRRVFYIHGYDPRGPSFYHRLYAEQAALQAALTGARIAVGRRRNDGDLIASWMIEAAYAGETVQTDYRILRWDDQVRAGWRQGELALLLQVWRGVFVFAASGVTARIARRWRAPLFASLFPLLVSSLYLLSAAMAGLVLWALARNLLSYVVPAPKAAWVALAAPLVLAAELRRGWRLIDAKLGVSWLSRCITYMIYTAADPSAAEARCDRFAAQVAEALGDPNLDEVMLVGHSQGAAHAVRTAARALDLAPGALSLLTLGQAFALYTALPHDTAFKADLTKLALSERLVWLDQTAPADPVSSSDIDPLIGLGVQEGRWPVRRSPRFHTLLGRARYRALQRHPLDFHFQYLRAGETAGAYDYFRLTAGPRRLLGEDNAA